MTERNQEPKTEPYDQNAKQPEAHEDMHDEVPRNISSVLASPYALDPDVISPLSTSPSTKNK